METRGNIFPKKNANFLCKTCDFKCCKKSDWERHVNTKKHEYRHNGNILETPGNNLAPKNAEIFCDCGKSYNSHSGIWKHKKSCPCVNQNGSKENTNKSVLSTTSSFIKISNIFVKLFCIYVYSSSSVTLTIKITYGFIFFLLNRYNCI